MKSKYNLLPVIGSVIIAQFSLIFICIGFWELIFHQSKNNFILLILMGLMLVIPSLFLFLFRIKISKNVENIVSNLFPGK